MSSKENFKPNPPQNQNYKKKKILIQKIYSKRNKIKIN